ncbi:MAG: hypothetical protein COB04_13175 [Gammaproteobacteria bacterium]|nr:MAG: hypothetical protein COB04_13175 [Gammaproteobacteria bacterium]
MDQLSKAIENLGMNRLIRVEDREIRLAILLRKEEWRHLSAPWWKGKAASIVGVDLDGNFLLCKSSGEFIIFEREGLKETLTSKNLGGMLSMLEMDATNIP